MDEAVEQVIRAELVRTQDDARKSIYRGAALIGVIPVVLVASVVAAFAIGGFGAFLAILLAATYMLIGSIAGVASIIGGFSEHRRSTRKLRELDEGRQLPTARLLLR